MNSLLFHELVESFGLLPHPEGGFYKETYRSEGKFENLPAPFGGDRSYSTAIYFLLPKSTRSVLHQIASDEVWHFYLGGPLTLIQIHPNGKCEKTVLGTDIRSGQKLQHVVPAGCWFGAFPSIGSDFSFVGCTVSPGFDFSDFKMANREELIGVYPQHRDEIEKLT